MRLAFTIKQQKYMHTRCLQASILCTCVCACVHALNYTMRALNNTNYTMSFV